MQNQNTTEKQSFLQSMRHMFGNNHEEKASKTHGATVAGMIAYHSTGAPAWTPRDYNALAKNGYGRNVIAHRCVRLIAEMAASVPLKVYEAGHQCTDHPLIGLLNKPNLEQGRSSFLEDVYGYLQVAGNAYIEAVEIDGVARELYALRPDRMKVRPNRNDWLPSYEYSVGNKKTIFSLQTDTSLKPILHIKLFNPSNDYYGLSPLEVSATAIDVHNASSSWNKALLDNAARPSGALVYKGAEGNQNMTREQFERLKVELEENYTSGINAGRPMVLEGGLDWKQMSFSPADMDFLEAKNNSAREIALAFGVPPMLLGIPGDNTYTNYKEANLALWRQTILPLVGKLTYALTNWLCENKAVEINFDVSQIEALSSERQSKLDNILNADFLTDAEKRLALGFPAEPLE